MRKNSWSSNDKDEYKFMEENEKEVELTVEDILMYSIENKYTSLIKECFQRINKSSLSLNCQIRLVVLEHMTVEEDFYRTDNMRVDRHVPIVCNLLRGMQFLMSNANIEAVREESFIASFMLKRWVCICHLYDPNEHDYLKKFLKLYFHDAQPNQFEKWIQDKRFSAQYLSEMKSFATNVEQYMKDEEAREEYFEELVYAEFERNFWQVLRHLIEQVVGQVKAALPPLLVDQLVANAERVEVVDDNGDSKKSQIVTAIFQRKKITEARLSKLLAAIKSPQPPPNHVMTAHNGHVTAIQPPRDMVTLDSLDCVAPHEATMHVHRYYSHHLPDDVDHVCASDDDCDCESDYGDHIETMYFPNFHKFLTDPG